jgi:protein SCO1/2
VRRSRFLVAAVLAALLACTACDKLSPPAKSPFHGVDVTGSDLGVGLSLSDPEGRPRTLGDFRGKVVAVTFGYTHCPDVCPTTLHNYALALKKLGADGARVQVLFVTLDPKRDTAQVLREYVPAFDPSFVGLRGDEAATDRVKKDFHVFSEEVPGTSAQDYTVNHSSQVFVFDASGRARLMIPAGTPSADIAADLRVLLDRS